MNCSILWLRRDFRLYDHKPLNQAVSAGLPIQPIFIFDRNILSRFHNQNDQRLSFIMECLIYLNKEIQKNNGELWVFYGNPEDIIIKLSLALKANKVFAGEDFEPQNIARDKRVSDLLKDIDKDLILSVDHLLMDPRSILKDNNEPYKVFTAFARSWKKDLNEANIADYTIAIKNKFLRTTLRSDLDIIDINNGPENALKQIKYKYQPQLLFKPQFARKKLNNFMISKIDLYMQKRDFFASYGTSECSPYIRFGLISIRECYRKASKEINSVSWINELVWRDFYAMILFRYPETVNQEFLIHYRNLKWENNREYFEKFCNGLTGYPIIDAAMRELKIKGWMHNRARMLVASFLSKILFIDWRLGEEHFAQYLFDYELASNVGGWQWAASVGTDAQPYFRMFNPFIQSKKFDPNGEYIRKYVPELRVIKDNLIHTPHVYKDKIDKFLKYPDYIVDFNIARELAKNFFKKS